ncbi:hypothetical protein ACS0TY_015676 [Phlomoides rotata]
MRSLSCWASYQMSLSLLLKVWLLWSRQPQASGKTYKGMHSSSPCIEFSTT